MLIAVVCGTNRQGALSRLLAQEAVEHYRRLGHETDLIDMLELPPSVLLPTAYKDRPADVQAIVDRFLRCDGAAFVVPEYNGSFPGILKLFVDLLPFPEGFDGRPCAFVGLAAGQFNALRSVEHFQAVAGYRNAHIFPRRLFIGNSFTQFEDGKLKDKELRQRLQDQADQFVKFVSAVRETTSGD